MPSVDLSDNEWGAVMNILADAPWKLSNPLLMKIGEQLRATAMQKHVANPQQVNPANGGQEVRHE